ncbi:MAG: biopolymer transporter ExbD [Longimicrobiaceae bacterium]
MPRTRDRSGTGLPRQAEINVVSLVDVAFTLLVIFIITAPIMQSGVEVDVPRARAEAITAPEGVVVSVTRDGSIHIGEARVQPAEFEAALVEQTRAAGASRVYLRADQGVPYGEVLRVLGVMKSADVAAVGLVAEPEPDAP